MDKLRALKSFCKVAETKSFAGAAFELGTVPSVLSKAIMALETSLQFKLLNRTTRRVTLTENGERYYEICRRLIAELDEAELLVKQNQGVAKGKLRVGLHPGINRLVMARLNEFFDIYPEIVLDTTMSSTSDSFIEDRLDVLIMLGELSDSTLTVKNLAVTQHVLVASPAYLKRSGRPMAPNDLRNHQFIVSGRPDGPSFGRWTFRRGEESEVIYVPVRAVSRQGTFMHEGCLSGSGIARLAQISIQPLIDEGLLTILLPDWSLGVLPVRALYPAGKEIPAKAQVFVEFVRTIIAANLAPAPKVNDRKSH